MLGRLYRRYPEPFINVVTYGLWAVMSLPAAELHRSFGVCLFACMLTSLASDMLLRHFAHHMSDKCQLAWLTALLFCIGATLSHGWQGAVAIFVSYMIVEFQHELITSAPPPEIAPPKPPPSPVSVVGGHSFVNASEKTWTYGFSNEPKSDQSIAVGFTANGTNYIGVDLAKPGYDVGVSEEEYEEEDEEEQQSQKCDSCSMFVIEDSKFKCIICGTEKESPPPKKDEPYAGDGSRWEDL
jgi:hypothetical protein